MGNPAETSVESSWVKTSRLLTPTRREKKEERRCQEAFSSAVVMRMGIYPR
jgi:hypothetical protein